MPQFEIRSRHEMALGQGNWVHRGDTFNILITIPNTVPGSLFGNQKNKESIVRQLAAQGVYLPPSSCWLNANHWDIKMR